MLRLLQVLTEDPQMFPLPESSLLFSGLSQSALEVHRIRCEAGDGSQEGPSSSSSKKLEGEAKMAHRRDLLQRLVYYDPVMGAAMTEESADDH